MLKKELGDWQGKLILTRVKMLFAHKVVDVDPYLDENGKIGYCNFWKLKSPFGQEICVNLAVYFEYMSRLGTLRCDLKLAPCGGVGENKDIRIFEVSVKKSEDVDNMVKGCSRTILETILKESELYVQKRKSDIFLNYVFRWLGGFENATGFDNEKLETYVSKTLIAPKQAKLYACRFKDSKAWCFFVKIGEEKNKLLLSRQEYDGFKETKDMKAFFDKKVFPWTDKLL